MTKPVDNNNEKPQEKPGKSTTKQLFAVFKLSPLVALVSVVFIYFASHVLAINLVATAGFIQGKTRQEVNDWLSNDLLAQGFILVLAVVLVVVMVRFLLHVTGESWKKIGLNKPKLRHVGEALIGYGWYFLLFLAATFLLRAFVTQVDLEQQQQLIFDRGSTGVSLWLIGFYIVAIPAFYEELLMRGVLFTGVRSKLSFWATLLIISGLFGAAHLEWFSGGPLNFAAAIDTFLLSGVLIYLRENSKSLWPAIFLHAIKNFVAFSLVFVFKIPTL